MAKRKYKYNGGSNNRATIFDIINFFNAIFLFIGFIFSFLFEVLKWTFHVISIIISLIMKLIIYINYKINKSSKKQSSVSNNLEILSPKPLIYNNISTKDDIEYEIKNVKMPKYEISTPYDELFSELIIIRGIDYFNNNTISN